MKFSLGGMLSAFTKKRLKSLALTIGELAISTVVVGGVAVLTLGGINNTIQTKQLQVRDTMLNNEVSVALAQMQANGELEGYKDTQEFMEHFKKYFGVKKVLTTDEEVNENFAPSYKLGSGKDAIDATAKDFEMQFISDKGESIAITYRPDYKPSSQYAADTSVANDANTSFPSIKARNDALGAIDGLYDVNGAKRPNKYNKDVGLFRVYDPPVQPCDCSRPEMQDNEACKPDYCAEHPSDMNCFCNKEENRNTKECICFFNPDDAICKGDDDDDDDDDVKGDDDDDDDDYCSIPKLSIPACESPEIDCCKDEYKNHICCGGYNPPVEECEQCLLTDDQCKNDNGRTLTHPDSKDCKCECLKPEKEGNRILDKSTCLYGCPIDFTKYSKVYADIEKSKEQCACVPKDPNAIKKCEESGRGRWDDKTCSCDCSITKGKPNDIYVACASSTCGYGGINEDNFCACECKSSNYNSNLGASAKTYDNKELDKVQKYTNFDNSTSNKCFTCNPSGVDPKYTVARGQCSCFVGCKGAPTKADKAKYPYFKFYDVGDTTNANLLCTWQCDVDKLKALVNELNKAKAGDDLRPFAMGKFQKTATAAQRTNGNQVFTYSFHDNTGVANNYMDFKNVNTKYGNEDLLMAQARYVIAANIGKLLKENNTSDAYYRHTGACTKDSCVDSYTKAFNASTAATNSLDINTPGRFFNFLVYFNGVETDKAFGHENGITAATNKYINFNKSADDLNKAFKMRYVANPAMCAVDLQEFNYGKEPTNDIWFHSDGINGNVNNVAVHQFTFEYAPNTKNFKVKNPNTETVPGFNGGNYPTPIVRPANYKNYDGRYNDTYWGSRKVGVIVMHNVQFDPLALNMNLKTPNDNPKFDKTQKVKAALVYNADKKTYDNASVYWPNNGYQFLVYKEYASNRNIGYMFSDVYSTKTKEQSKTGFDQLKLLDKNKDGLISGNELTDLRLLESGPASNLLDLTTSVFEINTHYNARMSKVGTKLQDSAAVYENQGEFRRLKPVDNIDSLCQQNTCLVFKEKAKNSTYWYEKWFDYSNNQTEYVLYPIGKSANAAYSKAMWYAADGVSQAGLVGNVIKLHVISGKYYEEFTARVVDIIFKTQ